MERILQKLVIFTLKKCLKDLELIIEKIQYAPIKEYSYLKNRLLQDLRMDCTNLLFLISRLEKCYGKEKENN